MQNQVMELIIALKWNVQHLQMCSRPFRVRIQVVFLPTLPREQTSYPVSRNGGQNNFMCVIYNV